MDNDRAAFKSWLAAYGKAWESRDAEAAAALYAEDGTYQVTPFLEPMRGRKAILEYWLGWRERKRTFDSSTRFWSRAVNRTLPDGLRRL
jgi:ketosteroid isomerase-like protein